MRNRLALLALAVPIALLASPGLAPAAPGDVIDGGVDLFATGKVVAVDEDSLAIRTDDHGHTIEFAIDQTTEMPDDLAVGKQVYVDYHPTGTTGQAADSVEITPPQQASR